MNLDDAQKKKVTGWIHEGLKLADIQKRIGAELGLNLTYMEVRLLVDDLKLIPKDPEPAPVPPAPPAPPTAPSPAMPTGGSGAKAAGMPAGKPGLNPLSPADSDLFGSKVSVGVDTVARPGAMVSGSVTFSDGQRGAWYMDQYGRLGVAPEKQGYKPSAADVESFQLELEKVLSRFGY